METVIDTGATTSLREQVTTVGSVIENRWIVLRQLGEGNFGAVYKVEDKKDLGKFYALKLEPLARSDRDPPRMMPLEVTVLRALRDTMAKRHP
uniref:Protein kinase domain-containing protein n=1 Tax=Romanomermis culicivorax TaxID=13658 RepID=A0A915I832_ROMCU